MYLKELYATLLLTLIELGPYGLIVIYFCKIIIDLICNIVLCEIMQWPNKDFDIYIYTYTGC